MAEGIARDNKIVATVGSDNNVGAAVWTLKGDGYLKLSGTKKFGSGTPYDIAHGPGNRFYVAGDLYDRSGTTVTEAVRWAITRTATASTQTGRMIITTLGDIYGVNGNGDVVGYTRPNGNGVGSGYIWHRGTTTVLDANVYAPTRRGQIAGWAQLYSPLR